MTTLTQQRPTTNLSTFQPFVEAYEPLKDGELYAKRLTKRILKKTSLERRLTTQQLQLRLESCGYKLPKYRMYKIIRVLRFEGLNIVADRNGLCITTSKKFSKAYFTKLEKISNSYSKLCNAMIANISKRK